MGKAAKLKQIRRLANQLPHVNTKGIAVNIMQGKELITNGIDKLKNGDEINPDGKYKQKIPITVPLNHYRKMKSLYNKYGATDVVAYAKAIQNHSNKMKNHEHAQG
jgi:hypothetical protein